MATRHIRGTSTVHTGSLSSNASPLLLARIEEKRTELANLRELRDLSAQLTSQMEMLEEKLATLNGGTEAVAGVLGNWADVLRAIGMASSKIPRPKETIEGGEQVEAAGGDEGEGVLPQTLVRIPVKE